MTLRKILKKITIGIICLTGLFLIALISFFYILDLHKEAVVNQVIQYVNKNFNSKLEVTRADIKLWDSFPLISVYLEDVKLKKDSLTSEPVFFAEHLSLSLKFLPLFYQKIEAGKIKVFNAGFSYTQKQKKEKKKDFKFPDLPPIEIYLNKFYFCFINEEKKKWYSFHCNQGVIAKRKNKLIVKGDFGVEGLSFNEDKGAYLSDTKIVLNLESIIRDKEQYIQILPNWITVNDHKYRLEGLLNWKDISGLNLQISASNANLNDVLKCLPYKLKEKLDLIVKAYGPVNKAYVKINAPFKEGQPRIDLDFEARNLPLRFYNSPLTVNGIHIDGHFSNHYNEDKPLSDENSIIKIDSLYAFADGINIKGKGALVNIKNPIVQSNLKLEGDLSYDYSVHNPLHKFNGQGKVFVRLASSIDPVALSNGVFPEKQYIKGYLYTKGIKLAFNNYQHSFGPINSYVTFFNNDINVKQIQAYLGNDLVKVSGTGHGLISFFLNPDSTLKFKTGLNAKNIDLKYLIPVKQPSNNPKSKKRIYNDLMELAQRWNLYMKIQSNSFTYQKIKATQVTGSVSWKKGTLRVDDWNMKMNEGDFNIKGYLTQSGLKGYSFYTSLNMTTMDVKKTFYTFENFSQDLLTARNLNGKLSLSINVKGTFNESFKLNNQSLLGNCKFKLQEGQIYDFQPVAGIAKFIFPGRDVKHITFKEISNELHIEDGEVRVPEMPIQTNLLTFYLQGTMNMKGTANFHLMAPWKEMKKKNVMDDSLYASYSRGIFLKASLENGKFKIGLDPEKRKEAKEIRKEIKVVEKSIEQ